MTIKQRSIHKLANALRALRGSPYRTPQKMAESRVRRWLNRCERDGYISPKLWKTPPTTTP